MFMKIFKPKVSISKGLKMLISVLVKNDMRPMFCSCWFDTIAKHTKMVNDEAPLFVWIGW